LIPLARPLYPPDAAARGKTPSGFGPDCEGIRRGVARLGRAPWEWATGQNKQKFTNTFAHGEKGTGGDVGTSGLAGFQRQMDIDDTGWYGTASHNALQYALVPDGLPHAGEHGLDDYARELLRQAVHFHKGDTSTVRAAALAEARSWLGYVESPAGSNANTFGAWYGMNYEPWCAMFVTYCYELAGPSPSFERGLRYAYCPYILDDAHARRNGLATTLEPKPGDLVLYDWSADGGGGLVDHVGLFEGWTGESTFTAIEGNTSTSNNSNGGQVMRPERSLDDADIYFVRVAEP
jgi:hypothetical protein